MIPIIIFLLSIVMQFAAAVYALLLIRITGRKSAWILISIALVLMTSRRVVSFVSILTSGGKFTYEISEIIALIIAALMLVGVLRIGDYFQSINLARIERQQAEKALVEKSRLLEAFFNNTLMCIALLDKNFNFIRVNESYARADERQTADFPGHNHFEFYPSEAKAIFEQVVATKKPFRASALPFVYAHHPERGITYWDWTLEPLLDDSGEVGSLIFTLNNVTERKGLESQLLHSQKMEAVGVLAGGIAHDFNNILTAVIGYAGVTQMKMKEDDPLRHNIEQIIASAERAANLTQGLLAFSRKQITNPLPLNLNDLINREGKLLSRIIGEDIAFETALLEEVLVVMADSGQLEQVLMNLATNARDAMPDGGRLIIGTEKVEIDEEYIKMHGYGKPGMYAVISVSDTGAGMDEATRQKIFEPFFTTKELGKGTGLGLSIVYGIIKQHNGYINCYSEKGKGATFKIYLPLTEGSAAEIKPAEPVAMLKGTETILLAEDEESVRKLAQTVLKEFGYKVIEAVDGEDAAAKFMENKDSIDLLLADVIMPRMSGKEAYELIKKIRPDIKVLLTSGYPTAFIHREEITDKELDFIAKPLSPTALLKKVREVLDKKE